MRCFTARGFEPRNDNSVDNSWRTVFLEKFIVARTCSPNFSFSILSWQHLRRAIAKVSPRYHRNCIPSRKPILFHSWHQNSLAFQTWRDIKSQDLTSFLMRDWINYSIAKGRGISPTSLAQDHLAQDTTKKNDFPRSRREHTLVRLDDLSVSVPSSSNFLADPSPTLRTDWLPFSGYGATG